MTILSHAPNAEDVVLARVFADQPAGFWIEIADPAAGSVTKLLGERGWRGTDVAPSASAEAPAARLDALLAQAPPSGVDLLRLAVGGSEAAVLATADWETVRPRLLLIAAVDATGAPSHQKWHRRMVTARYGFALFDGINRYYVRQEDEGALLPRLAAPAHALDDWRWAADAARIAALEADLGELREAAAPAGGVAAIETELADQPGTSDRIDQLEAELAALREAAQRDAAVTTDAALEIENLKAELAAARSAAQDAQSAAAAASSRAEALAAELATRPPAAPKVSGPLGWLTGSGRGR